MLISAKTIQLIGSLATRSNYRNNPRAEDKKDQAIIEAQRPLLLANDPIRRVQIDALAARARLRKEQLINQQFDRLDRANNQKQFKIDLADPKAINDRIEQNNKRLQEISNGYLQDPSKSLDSPEEKKITKEIDALEMENDRLQDIKNKNDQEVTIDDLNKQE